MKKWYNKLFSVGASHTYYDISGESKDLSFRPTADTLEQLNNYKLILKSTDSGLKVYYEATDGSGIAALPLPGTGINLRFQIGLKNSGFPNFTNLTTPGDGQMHLFKSPPSGTALTHQLVNVQTQSFLFTFSHALATSADVTVTDRNSTTVFNQTGVSNYSNDGSENLFKVFINLEDQPAGHFTIAVALSGYTNPPDEEYYLDNAAAAERPYGMLEILADNTTNEDFDFGFTHQSSNWKYFVVQAGAGAATYTIDEITTTYSFPVKGSLTAEEQQTRDGLLETQPSGSVVVLFESASAIPYSESPLLDIQLKKDGTAIINNLSNPSIDQAKSEVFVFV